MGDPLLPMVTASTGVMNSLLAKLEKLSKDDNSFLKEVRTHATKLKDELEIMHRVLLEFAAGVNTDLPLMEWMRQVREVAYDAEDYIDLYTHAHQPQPQHLLLLEKKSSKGKSSSLFPWRPFASKKPEIATRIQELTVRIKEANQRREAYKLTAEAPANDPDKPAESGSSADMGAQLLLNAAGFNGGDVQLVGMDRPSGDLRRMLLDFDRERQLKVVSVVGVGGSGKTTLVSEVFGAIQAEFDCRAFAKLGRNTHMKATLLSILSQVTQKQHNTDEDDQDLIRELRNNLVNKRYLIGMDDIWSVSAWKVIKCALPEGSSGSRIITTTRSNEVAHSCTDRAFIHEMVPLSDSDSQTLFHSIITWKEPDSSALQIDFSSILKICAGLPLAVVAIAGLLLTRKYSKSWDWKGVNNYVASLLQQYPKLQGMRRILHACYSDLPSPVKTCFLYLSSFPEYQMVKKDRLVWRWIAEGFIPMRAGGGAEESMWNTGQRYFNELINRRLIQPIFSAEDHEPEGCMVHSEVLGFISLMSRDENFVVMETGLPSMPRGVVRRLSLNCINEEDDDNNLALESENVNLSHVRSLTLFGSAGWLMSLLENFSLLRVLDLQNAHNLDDSHLQCLGRKAFFHLKYLGLGGDGVKRLPEDIKFLEYLETLDVRETGVKALPDGSLAGMRRLARLLANDLPLQDGMENMSDLQELGMVSITGRDTLQRVANLMKMKRLRILGVNWRMENNDDSTSSHKDPVPFQGTQGKSSVECLLLHVSSDRHRSLDEMVDKWVPPFGLQKFVMTSSGGYFFRTVPTKMKDLTQLVHLTIAIAQLGEKDLQLLISLPTLVILKLSTRDSTSKKTIISQGFPNLKVFSFKCQDGLLGFVFGEGSMPKLQDLQLCFKAGEEKNLRSIRHLSTLRKVQATVNCDGAGDSAFKTAEEEIKKIVEAHPDKLSFEVIKDLKDDKNVKQNQGQLGKHGSKRTQ